MTTGKSGLLIAAALIVGAALGVVADEAWSGGDKPSVEVLLDTRTTNLGQPIVYPTGEPAHVTAIIVTLEPGQETGRHRHPIPLYGQVLSGQVTVDYGDKGSKTYRAGEAFMEAMNTWHNGRNSGDETLRILAVYMGADGLDNVVRP